MRPPSPPADPILTAPVMLTQPMPWSGIQQQCPVPTVDMESQEVVGMWWSQSRSPAVGREGVVVRQRDPGVGRRRERSQGKERRGRAGRRVPDVDERLVVKVAERVAQQRRRANPDDVVVERVDHLPVRIRKRCPSGRDGDRSPDQDGDDGLLR